MLVTIPVPAALYPRVERAARLNRRSVRRYLAELVQAELLRRALP